MPQSNIITDVSPSPLPPPKEMRCKRVSFSSSMRCYVSKASSNMRLLGIELYKDWWIIDFLRGVEDEQHELSNWKIELLSTFLSLLVVWSGRLQDHLVLENAKVFFFMPCLCQNFFWLASWIIDLYVICMCGLWREEKLLQLENCFQHSLSTFFQKAIL